MSDEKFYGMRPEVAWFANEMERKLLNNDAKGGWGHMTLKRLLSRLKQEVAELEVEINKKGNVIGEAADVANFAMMIADNFYYQLHDDVEDII